MKSETRKMLEEQLHAAELKAQQEEALLKNNIKNEAEQFLTPPQSFKAEFAEEFASLPVEWRRFLIERDNEMQKDKGELSDALRQKQWIDDLLNQNRLRLRRLGVDDLQKWLEHLVRIDAAMDENPAAVLQEMAAIYGVKIPTDAAEAAGQAALMFQHKIDGLEKICAEVKMSLKRQQDVYWRAMWLNFAHETSDNGEPKHPFFEEVKPEMQVLLDSGLAVDLEDAYQQAIWMKPETRRKMIVTEKEKVLSQKVEEAQKAKQAGFAPKGKPKTMPQEHLTTRQLLERAMYGK